MRYLLLSLLFVSNALAGGRVGNGDFVIGINGKLALADLHFKAAENTPYTFDDELEEQLKFINEKILRDYDINADQFFKEQVFDNRVAYDFVTELPCKAEIEEDVLLDVDYDFIHQIACTNSWFTYVVPDLFHYSSLAPQIIRSVEEKAALIVHERLHALTDDHRVIFPFVKGILLLQDIYSTTRNGIPLTDKQVKTIEEFLLAAKRLNLQQPGKNYRVHKNGGGIISADSKSLVAKSAFVSAGSKIISSVVSSKTVIIQSDIYHSSIRSNSVVENSRLYKTSVDHEVMVRSSIVWTKDYYEPGSSLVRLNIGHASGIVNVRFFLNGEQGHFIQNNSYIQKSEFFSKSLYISSGAILKDFSVSTNDYSNGDGIDSGSGSVRIGNNINIKKCKLIEADKHLRINNSSMCMNANKNQYRE